MNERAWRLASAFSMGFALCIISAYSSSGLQEFLLPALLLSAISGFSYLVLWQFGPKIKNPAHFAIPLLYCIPIVLGAVPSQSFRISISMSAMVCLPALASEIFRDIDGKSWLSSKIGAGNAGTAAAFASLGAVALGLVPFFLHIFGYLYALAIITADALLIYSLWLALGKEQYANAGRMIAVSIIVGVAAFAIGRIAAGLGF